MHRIKIGVWAAVLATCVGACVTADPSNNSPPAEAHLQAQPQAATPSAADQPSSADLGTQCLQRFTDPQQAPTFDYDQFKLRPEDRTALEQVARCITAGPFKGHKLHLIGRADPRGHAEYTWRSATAGSVP
jgi:outer membrane protein OmpA-like peptidoglycan-associated protein